MNAILPWDEVMMEKTVTTTIDAALCNGCGRCVSVCPSDTIAILAHGRIVAQGAASELVKPGENLEKYFMQVVGGKGQGASGTETATGETEP